MRLGEIHAPPAEQARARGKRLLVLGWVAGRISLMPDSEAVTELPMELRAESEGDL